MHGPHLILCADHNSLILKHRDAFAPLEFEHDTSFRAREHEVAALAKAGLHDVWVDIHCPTLTDIKDKESLCPTGFTYGYPRERERLDSQRLRRTDRIHATSEMLSLATSVYPMFAAKSDHKAILAEFTPPSFETEGTTPRFYFPEAILQDPEAMEELETSLKSITSTEDQWWEDALGEQGADATPHPPTLPTHPAPPWHRGHAATPLRASRDRRGRVLVPAPPQEGRRYGSRRGQARRLHPKKGGQLSKGTQK